ncbi:hypothetical protein P170DRAFT_429607 [Aspergillus steynii IBT 23096]|uniref:F-box domain-containing protein n=1 Tax=Aspergillus steynii IBT 23096 TaxID=1392250 RepID=A0A2I2FW77_9EURO|nr:uncharacterized protein P170DRAFT_429607 [Aspergillus steynii IBT 23096]PLB44874.1 hypothetical protein P170DRAFT_429607 [Aspergillus steynii IBT 23096]
MASGSAHDLICFFCGVAFNIARVRKVEEPVYASWGSDMTWTRNLEKFPVNLSNCVGNLCSIGVYETPGKRKADGDPLLTLDVLPGDYTAGRSGPPEHREVLVVNEDTVVQMNGTWPGLVENIEHLPGPFCFAENAYNGGQIQLREMNGCRTAQFLIPSDPTMPPKKDGLEEDWEYTSGYFRSGLCNGLCMDTMSQVQVYPPRGGVKYINASEVIPEGPMNAHDPHGSTRFSLFGRSPKRQNMSLPFHPWCFEIFSRCSKLHLGRVAVDGLKEYCKVKGGFTVYCNLENKDNPWSHPPRWKHIRGQEYMAANPLDIPGLESLLSWTLAERSENSVSEESKDPNPPKESVDKDKAAMIKDTPNSLPTSAKGNTCATLSQVMMLGTLDLLDMKDIKSLRLVSRGLQHLPDTIWCRMLREDMPWLFEAWNAWGFPGHIPSRWAFTAPTEMRGVMDYLRIYKPLEYPDILIGLRREKKIDDQFIESKRFGFWLSMTIKDYNLPKELEKTNWYAVYTGIKRDWRSLKGLQNRKRIWGHVNRMVEDMKKIVENPP